MISWLNSGSVLGSLPGKATTEPVQGLGWSTKRRRHFCSLAVRPYLCVIIERWNDFAHVLDSQPRITNT
ncbi:hypothetical protein IAS59_003657 [Cryptococcus gattii]